MLREWSAQPGNVAPTGSQFVFDLSRQRFGLIDSGQELPIQSVVMRYVSYGRLAKDCNDVPVGPASTAFKMRGIDEYLSVTWCGYFSGSYPSQLRCAVEALRGSKMDVKPKGCFCIGRTDAIFSAVSKFRQPRAIYWPEPDNVAHAGIYGIDPENGELLEILATEVWSSFLTKEDADALPESSCDPAK